MPKFKRILPKCNQMPIYFFHFAPMYTMKLYQILFHLFVCASGSWTKEPPSTFLLLLKPFSSSSGLFSPSNKPMASSFGRVPTPELPPPPPPLVRIRRILPESELRPGKKFKVKFGDMCGSRCSLQRLHIKSLPKLHLVL